MKLFAKKSCSFGGKRFAIGDEIPADLVLNPATQERLGVLSIANDAPLIAVPCEAPKVELLTVPLVIHTKDNDVALDLPPESIQTVMDVLTANAEDAANRIKEITSDDILFLVNAADSRKSVQAAAKARAQALAEESSEPEQPEEPGESAGEQ